MISLGAAEFTVVSGAPTAAYSPISSPELKNADLSFKARSFCLASVPMAVCEETRRSGLEIRGLTYYVLSFCRLAASKIAIEAAWFCASEPKS